MTERTISRAEAGQRLDKYLGKYLDAAPKSFLYKMLRKKNITLNGSRADGASLLKEGDVVRLYLSDETIRSFRGGKKKAGSPGKTSKAVPEPDVLFENDDILILNKPAGLLSQGDRSGERSAADFLREYLLKTGAVTEETLMAYRPSPCHRLDRMTSGLLICGKTMRGQQAASEMIRERAVKKYYLALVHGPVKAAERRTAYGHKDASRNVLEVREAPAKGFETLITAYEPLARAEGLTLLKVELVTGKSHQIRAHMAHLRHPLVGDKKYGAAGSWPESDRTSEVRRQCLHAWQLVFPEKCPIAPELAGRTFSAPLPEDFKRVLKMTGITAPERPLIAD